MTHHRRPSQKSVMLFVPVSNEAPIAVVVVERHHVDVGIDSPRISWAAPRIRHPRQSGNDLA